MKLTDPIVASIQPSEKIESYRDDEQFGLTLRVYPNGTKNWYLEARLNGRLYNRKIAPVSVYKTREARMMVKQLIGELVQGKDAKLDRKQKLKAEREEAAKLRKAENIQKAHQKYVSTVQIKPSTVLFYKKLLENGLKPYSQTRLHEVDSDFIRSIFEEISSRVTPLHATKCVRYIRTLCLWRELPNPVPHRMRLESSKPRQARLDPQDGLLIWKRLQETPKRVSAAYLSVMLLTGCRTTELSTLKVGQVDLVAGYFKLADTKNGRDHRVYLSEPAAAIVARFMKGKDADEVVFTNAKEGRAIKEKLQDIKEWSNHDLRKLFAIVAMEIGIAYPIIKAALNHSTGDVTIAHYAHATPSQLRSCWERIGDYYTGKSKWNDLKTINEPLSGQQNVSVSPLTSPTQPSVFREKLESSQTV